MQLAVLASILDGRPRPYVRLESVQADGEDLCRVVSYVRREREIRMNASRSDEKVAI